MQAYFERAAHQAEKETLPLLRALIARYAEERPFAGRYVAFGHLLVRNSLVVVEALVVGGAEVYLSDAFSSPASEEVVAELAKSKVKVYPVAEAVEQADLYLDVNAVLGRAKTPRAAAEVTRTGVLHYEKIACPVVSADNCRAKLIEGFFGTGDGFLRAWRQLRPEDELRGKRVVQFGYGKIGRGVAHVCRREGLDVQVADLGREPKRRAVFDGFEVLDAEPNAALRAALEHSDIVIAVTGVPGAIGRTIPAAWLRAGGAVLVNLGAEDEYGDEFAEGEILGGKRVPLNFHLAQPTRNRYVDAPLAAHLLALEAWLRAPEEYPPGVHALPKEMDDWLIAEWRRAWPDEDLTGIGEELGL